MHAQECSDSFRSSQFTSYFHCSNHNCVLFCTHCIKFSSIDMQYLKTVFMMSDCHSQAIEITCRKIAYTIKQKVF